MKDRDLGSSDGEEAPIEPWAEGEDSLHAQSQATFGTRSGRGKVHEHGTAPLFPWGTASASTNWREGWVYGIDGTPSRRVSPECARACDAQEGNGGH